MLQKRPAFLFINATVFLALNSFGMGQARPNLDASDAAAPMVKTMLPQVNASAPKALPPMTTSDIEQLATSPRANTCSRISENSFSKMSHTLTYFDDVAAGDYLLMRKPSIDGVDQYDVVLNYQFFGDDPDKIAANVTQCFQSMNPYLKGPNGEQMNLRLPLPSDPMLPAVHQVAVSDQCGSRGEALCWRPVYDCATVLHETMHHLGLVDEYAEMGCRSLGPVDSLMTNPTTAYQAVLPKYILHTYSCEIFSGDAQTQCLHGLDLVQSGMSFTHDPSTSYYTVKFSNGDVAPMRQMSDGTLFPQQFPELMSGTLWPPITLSFQKDGWSIPDETPATLAALALTYAKPVRLSPTSLNVVEVVPAKRSSILYPAEASTLLYGNCAANSVFLSCEHNAYADHFCGGKPAVCGNGTPSDAWVQMPSGVTP